MALDASALDRETRGFISMTMSRPVCGSTANWMLQPPVSTPTARMTSIATSRMRWYSRSVSVMAGATVMLSPVCTPIGSRFSMEQTTTTLSLRSRMSSSSNSFQPRIDSSSSTSRGRAGAQAGTRDAAQVALVVRQPGAGAAHGERGPDDDGIAELRCRREAAVQVVRDGRPRGLGTDGRNDLLEPLAVLPRLDGVKGGADQLDAVLLRGRPARAAQSRC